MKDLRVKNFQSRPQESKALTSQYSNSAETSKQTWKEKKKISNIEAKSLKRAPSQSLGAIWLIPLQESFEPKKILVRSFATIVAKKDTILPRVPSYQSQTTFTGLGNFRVDNWG